MELVLHSHTVSSVYCHSCLYSAAAAAAAAAAVDPTTTDCDYLF